MAAQFHFCSSAITSSWPLQTALHDEPGAWSQQLARTPANTAEHPQVDANENQTTEHDEMRALVAPLLDQLSMWTDHPGLAENTAAGIFCIDQVFSKSVVTTDTQGRAFLRVPPPLHFFLSTRIPQFLRTGKSISRTSPTGGSIGGMTQNTRVSLVPCMQENISKAV